LLLLDDAWFILTRNIKSTNSTDPKGCDLGAQFVSAKSFPYVKETNSDH